MHRPHVMSLYFSYLINVSVILRKIGSIFLKTNKIKVKAHGKLKATLVRGKSLTENVYVARGESGTCDTHQENHQN